MDLYVFILVKILFLSWTSTNRGKIPKGRVREIENEKGKFKVVACSFVWGCCTLPSSYVDVAPTMHFINVYMYKIRIMLNEWNLGQKK